MRRALMAIFLIVTLIGAANDSTVVTAQILDYEKGWLFLTTGDGFHVSPAVTIVDGPPQTRDYARITFDPTGVVTRIEVSRIKLPAQGDLMAVHRYAFSLSKPVPNPEIDNPVLTNRCSRTRGGKTVGLTVTVQVPPTTGSTDTIYMSSD